MNGRLKLFSESTEAKSGQTCCFSHFPPHSPLTFTVISFCLQEGNPDFFIAAIVISAWILRTVTGGGRGGGTTRCPCRQRCIKMVMSHPICRAHLSQQRGFLCTSVFSFTAVISLPLLFASSLSLLTPPLTLCNPLVRNPPSTLQWSGCQMIGCAVLVI